VKNLWTKSLKAVAARKEKKTGLLVQLGNEITGHGNGNSRNGKVEWPKFPFPFLGWTYIHEKSTFIKLKETYKGKTQK
jgi:hypothetical protein